jgi:hypothetical protein
MALNASVLHSTNRLQSDFELGVLPAALGSGLAAESSVKGNEEGCLLDLHIWHVAVSALEMRYS